jgi:hypothetical protein
MRHSKNALSGLSSLQSLAVSVLNVAGMALGPIPGADHMTGPPFNIVISNVPGPSSPRYWNGARLDNLFPASIPVDGQALNITATSYAGTLQFGLVGCRRSVPSLQRMLVHLEESLTELEQATGSVFATSPAIAAPSVADTATVTDLSKGRVSQLVSS